MRSVLRYMLVAGIGILSVGCGGETTLSTKPFTDEEKAKIKAEDEAVAAEEGGKPVKKKK